MNTREFLACLAAGGLAGASVDLTLFPLDTLKTRLQSAQGFARAGGFRGVYAGVPSAAVGSFPNGGVSDPRARGGGEAAGAGDASGHPPGAGCHAAARGYLGSISGIQKHHRQRDPILLCPVSTVGVIEDGRSTRAMRWTRGKPPRVELWQGGWPQQSRRHWTSRRQGSCWPRLEQTRRKETSQQCSWASGGYRDCLGSSLGCSPAWPGSAWAASSSSGPMTRLAISCCSPRHSRSPWPRRGAVATAGYAGAASTTGTS
ncbi:mitochondrial S-adenosylmethionine carrier protein isoform X2 [Lethenteron reissneri]|uniref:mitochondrial S-adenosylmethionine carrier protein isoform X2 n=1 Tax=Lethenteron reissneri TaxID=7753 RepID=UPI002AB62BE9|nr:mitochondrial S-adenosylmethionine carrier protein isoform X2 [Lethenteron reissneri]